MRWEVAGAHHADKIGDQHHNHQHGFVYAAFSSTGTDERTNDSVMPAIKYKACREGATLFARLFNMCLNSTSVTLHSVMSLGVQKIET